MDTIVLSLAQYGRVLIWNRDDSNMSRILVKLRAFSIDYIPLSIVVSQSTSNLGTGDSWTCPTIILSVVMLGAGPGDEDILPPEGENPHPVPIVVDDFHFWHADHDGEMQHGGTQDEAVANANDNENIVEPVIVTPPQSPVPAQEEDIEMQIDNEEVQIVVPLNGVIAEQAPQDHVDQAPADAPTEEPMPVIQAPPRRRRGKAAVPPNVEGVRRSNRLAGLKA